MANTPVPQPATAQVRAPLAIAISVLATLVGLIVLMWGILYVTKGRFLRQTFESVAGRQMPPFAAAS